MDQQLVEGFKDKSLVSVSAPFYLRFSNMESQIVCCITAVLLASTSRLK